MGENILRPRVLDGEENILEYMTQNNQLTRYYEKAAGFEFLNDSVSKMMLQLTNKFPHMRICEVGAGTGGATKAILGSIGQNFASYVYTDISSGFFETAQVKLQGHTQKMLFKTLNIERDPAEQGFTDASFDCIVAANVLHATSNLQDTMRNVRRLLKPGGYLVMFEVINQDVMRFGAVMGGLPGWWVGKDDGRIFAPTISLAQWDDLFKETGFSGVETHTPMFDPIAIPQSIFCTMAIDDDINLLRDPLAVGSFQAEGPLILLSGPSEVMKTICKRIADSLRPFFHHVIEVESLTKLPEIPTSPHILALGDCGGSVFNDMTDNTWRSLQSLLEAPKSILWVTCGAYLDNYDAAMSLGLIRNLVYELLETSIHTLDIASEEEIDVEVIVRLMLQIATSVSLKAQGKYHQMTWTVEPELRWHDGRFEMLRVRPQLEQNARLNSIRRPILQNLSIENTQVILQPEDMGYVLIEAHGVARSEEHTKIAIKTTTSLLLSIRTTVGFVQISLGAEEKSTQTVLCLSEAHSSTIEIDPSWAIVVPSEDVIDRQFLSIVAGVFIIEELLRTIPSTGSVLCHELDPGLGSLLSRRLSERGQSCLLTSSDPEVRLRSGNWLYLHERAALHTLEKALPRDITCFLDGSSLAFAADSLAHRIRKALPPSVQVWCIDSLFSRVASPLPSTAPEDIRKILRTACDLAIELTNGVPDGAPLEVETLRALASASYSKALRPSLVDWRTEAILPISVRPISTRNDLFIGDVTYWLAGISGDLARSLADYMVAHGARHIALSSRNPREDTDWVEWHRSCGVQVSYFSRYLKTTITTILMRNADNRIVILQAMIVSKAHTRKSLTLCPAWGAWATAQWCYATGSSRECLSRTSSALRGRKFKEPSIFSGCSKRMEMSRSIGSSLFRPSWQLVESKCLLFESQRGS